MTQSKQLTPIGQICQAIDKMGDNLGKNLKHTGIPVDRFLTTAKTAVQTHGDQERLAKADRTSLYLAIQKAAGDGLMPDGREAALVVYGNSVQYQPMVQGLVKLARKSGEIDAINSEVVFENDEFEFYHDLDGATLKHQPNWKGDRGEPILVWASVKLKSGERIARALTKDRIMQIASRSKMAGNYDPKKGKDWEEFWRKAAIRNILKYAPKSTYLDHALQEDNNEFDMEEKFVQETKTTAPEDKPKKQTRAAAKVKAQAKEEPTPEDNPYEQGDVIEAEAVEVSEDEEIPV